MDFFYVLIQAFQSVIIRNKRRLGDGFIQVRLIAVDPVVEKIFTEIGRPVVSNQFCCHRKFFFASCHLEKTDFFKDLMTNCGWKLLLHIPEGMCPTHSTLGFFKNIRSGSSNCCWSIPQNLNWITTKHLKALKYFPVNELVLVCTDYEKSRKKMSVAVRKSQYLTGEILVKKEVVRKRISGIALKKIRLFLKLD